ncbi:MAG: hypothetical protein HYV07_01380 [Deltaproteobacteria bacterium]|nr:hypothetical protein [Deltaproteobacteria bacterium]
MPISGLPSSTPRISGGEPTPSTVSAPGTTPALGGPTPVRVSGGEPVVTSTPMGPHLSSHAPKDPFLTRLAGGALAVVTGVAIGVVGIVAFPFALLGAMFEGSRKEPQDPEPESTTPPRVSGGEG